MSRTQSRRHSSAVPEFDPYGYSPFDAKFQQYNEDSNPSSRSKSTQVYHLDEDEYDHARSHGHRRSSPKSSTRSSRQKNDHHREKKDNDDEWDTDYDPRDKYYLSGDEGYEVDYRSPTGRSPTRRHSGHRHSRDHDLDDEKSRRSSHHERRQTHHSHHHDSPARRDVDNDHDRSHHHHHHKPAAAPSRPTRPRAVSRYSSYNGRSRARHPANARGKATASAAPGTQFPWQTAARVALQAGAITALKIHRGPGTMLDKGTRVATSAIGAGLVDALMTKNNPKGIRKGGIRHAAVRQVAEVCLGNMVVGPAAKTVARRR